MRPNPPFFSELGSDLPGEIEMGCADSVKVTDLAPSCYKSKLAVIPGCQSDVTYVPSENCLAHWLIYRRFINTVQMIEAGA
ncbi:MAG: hypothetical protein JJU13_02570 [Balneolaceae bacterium]|nr:hypothetical protein [Balneolaceae bacterium]